MCVYLIVIMTDLWLLLAGTNASTSTSILLMIFVKCKNHSRIGPMTL